MVIAQPQPPLIVQRERLKITWDKLPDDFILPGDPVDNNLQPLLAEALRESLELAGLFSESMLIATNFGICATVADKTVVKAPDWVYIPEVKPLSEGVIRRSYTPRLEGDIPLMVLEFISETEGTEYSLNPHYPYGKWYFYERIIQVPLYGIFQPETKTLDLFRLVDGRYEPQVPDENSRFWIPEMNLFLGTWDGQRSNLSTTWLRWWDSSDNLLLWGREQVEQERQRAELLASKLRALGVEPDEGGVGSRE
ncbi:MAG: Uma2 family endonuclease [Cyanobacteria bacterium REEB459]|nr:Uma2 family endonuclease [Cyanobacteria bacterium REEB459]